MKILILGAGVYGQALGQVLSDNGHEISFYDVAQKEILVDIPVKPKVYHDIRKALNFSPEIIVLCIPSEHIEEILTKLPTGVPLVIASKGLLSPNMFNEFDFMLLSGAGYADEIVRREETKLTATDNRVVELFTTDYLTFDETSDVLGVMLCGALKNVYAIGAGIRNLTPYTDDWEDYIKATASEMERILAINGADSGTLQLSCGVKDLILTAGPRSRNYNFGKAIYENKTDNTSRPSNDNSSRSRQSQTNVTVEGLNTIRELKRKAIILPDDIPILSSIISEVLCD